MAYARASCVQIPETCGGQFEYGVCLAWEI